jgi:ribonuclease-3
VTIGNKTMSWLASHGFDAADPSIWRMALTHGSMGEAADYERLEFLGDRVLALSIAGLLFEDSEADEGLLSLRLNALVSRASCAAVAREIGVADHVRMGAQARNDGGADSDNILGDVVEALLGANFREAGFEATRRIVARLWADRLAEVRGHGKHPKSALQEWAAANRRRPPQYELIERSGPDHAARFMVEVRVMNVGEARATAASKQEAETRAAALFLERHGS